MYCSVFWSRRTYQLQCCYAPLIQPDPSNASALTSSGVASATPAASNLRAASAGASAFQPMATTRCGLDQMLAKVMQLNFCPDCWIMFRSLVAFAIRITWSLGHLVTWSEYGTTLRPVRHSLSVARRSLYRGLVHVPLPGRA